jgi:PPM family protein phosphatase
MAVETIVKHCMDAQGDSGTTQLGLSEPSWSEKARRLTNAVHLANKSIYEAAEANPEQHGMGATLTAGWIDGSKLSIAHVGDSRAYLLRSGNLQQLTSDHSLVAEQVRRGILTAAEAEESEMQSVLLRALGALPDIEVDTDEHTLFAGDILMFCCDGLTRMVTEPEIAGTLQAEPDATKAAEKLIALANERGGVDNITVIVVRVGSESRGWWSWLFGGERKKAAGNGAAGGS